MRICSGADVSRPFPRADMLSRPTSDREVEFKDWRALGVENLVVGQVESTGAGEPIRFSFNYSMSIGVNNSPVTASPPRHPTCAVQLTGLPISSMRIC